MDKSCVRRAVMPDGCSKETLKFLKLKGDYMSKNKSKSMKAGSVKLSSYKNSDLDVNKELSNLINNNRDEKDKFERESDIRGNRCTVIISVPKKWGGSFSDHPGHCGIVLWNSSSYNYQSFGILSDGTFADEEVNVHNDYLKYDVNFKIWYFTKKIDESTYSKLKKRMSKLGKKKVGYGKFFVARGWVEDGSYSCVTAVDTILCAGGLSKGIAAMTSTPYAYAQTFTRMGWYISYADSMKHM